jgi:hypothetical protein
MVIEPRVLDLRDRISLLPDPQDVLVVDLGRGGHDPESRSRRPRHESVLLYATRFGQPDWHCWSSGGALAQRSAAQARDRGCRTLALIGIPFRNYMERRSGKQGNPEDHSE